MSIFNEPPTFNAVVDQGLKATYLWALWANNVAYGDAGTGWTPAFTGLTSAGGTPTITGVYYLISNSLVYFRVIITPASGGTTTSVAGTTYMNNFPLTVLAPAGFSTIAGNASAALGTTNASNNNFYTPAWTALTGQVILSGIVEAQ